MERFRISPDGRYIAFLSADEPTSEEEIKESQKDDARVWGERTGKSTTEHGDISWSDGLKGHSRLRLFTISTGQVRTLVEDIRHIVSCTWGPDSKVPDLWLDMDIPLTMEDRNCFISVVSDQILRHKIKRHLYVSFLHFRPLPLHRPSTLQTSRACLAGT